MNRISLFLLRDRKRKLKILILGAYRPRNMLKRLENLRDCLIKRGFKTTKLVKDIHTERFDIDQDVHFTKKSRSLMKNWAHVPIFVFFIKGKNLGVGNELGYTCSKLSTKVTFATVFLEKNLNVGSQIRGTIKLAKRDQKLSYERFDDDEDLCNLAFGHCRKKLDHLFYYLD